jgi:hypothetical protein
MAGSFNLFRRYQKAALAGLAIMAMLAFFVLPPLLQLGGGGPQRGDGTVVRWQGGGLRESGLQRAVLTRRALNQFLMALRAAATGDERVQPPLRDDEKGVVDALLLAREAVANGIVVSDSVINDFLAMWTGDMVTSAQMQNVIGQLRDRAGVTEADIFDALRTVILGERLQALALRGTGFSGAPPGWRWDAFRKLEQGATVEVVPVVVESLAGEVAEPSTAALEGLYARYRDDLPRARSATPGFREPARARYDALVAKADLFVAEAEKDVTDEQIAKFYEDNKERMFKQAPEPESEPPADAQPAAEPEADGGADAKPAAEPASEAPAEPAAAKEQPASPAEPSPEPEPAAEPQAAAGPSRPAVLPVAFRQPAAEAVQEAAETVVQETAPAAETAAAVDEKAAGSEDKPAAAEEKPAPPEEKPAEPVAEAKAADEFQPLEKVRDEIRKQLATQAAEQKISEIFATITSRIAAHSDRVEEAIGLNEPLPAAPDVMKLAAEQGLEGVRSEFVTPAETVAAGGIGSSFLLAFSDRFGVRQQRWIDLIFTPDAPRFRPVVTRDVEGSRYLSWKTEDRPAFTPALADIKPEVERVWRLIEARPLARKQAEAVAAAAADKPLADVVAGREGLEASTVGPFTWLTRGTAPFGSPPMRNDPEGIEMAGDEFLAAVFGLEPGQTAVAFNEPQTVCYAIRLVGLEPSEEVLQERFVEAANDPRRLAMLAEDETRDAFDRWLAGIEKRQGVEWLRDPR